MGVLIMGINSNIDILKKVADIERLKCELLSNTADFFKTTAETRNNDKTGADVLCALLTNVYLLAAQHGISYEELDARAAALLRSHVLSDDAADEVKKLLRHFVR